MPEKFSANKNLKWPKSQHFNAVLPNIECRHSCNTCPQLEHFHCTKPVVEVSSSTMVHHAKPPKMLRNILRNITKPQNSSDTDNASLWVVKLLPIFCTC